MSKSVTQSCAKSLCTFLKHQLQLNSPLFAALLIYLQKLSRGSLASYLSSHVRRICHAIRELMDKQSGIKESRPWTGSLHVDNPRHSIALENMFVNSVPLSVTFDAAKLLVEELKHMDANRLGSDDIVFAYEFFADPEHRQQEGSFFTDADSARRILEPLCLDKANAELSELLGAEKGDATTEKRRLLAEKVRSWCFFDPACGAGSILVATKRQVSTLLRKICEDCVVPALVVDSDHFSGIELDVDAAGCAELALRIVDEDIEATQPTCDRITIGNAVTLEWRSLSPRGHFDFIVGNPPFLGGSSLSTRQRNDMQSCWGHLLRTEMDYVSCWFMKAAKYINAWQQTRAAFLSTDSITQGSQIDAIWPTLLRMVRIAFAYESVRWNPRLLVNVVIIGLESRNIVSDTSVYYSAVRNEATGSLTFVGEKTVCELAPHMVPNIPFVSIKPRAVCLNPEAPPIHAGCMLQDSSDFQGFVATRAQLDVILAETPSLAPYWRPYSSARHTLAGREVYCLDLFGCDKFPTSAEIARRVEHVRATREQSTSAEVRKYARTPSSWTSRKIPKPGVLLMMPVTSGENYCYFPIVRLRPSDYIANNASVICSNTTLYVESESYYVFGILQSAMHRAWVAALCGTNGSSTRYNAHLYKTFPWPAKPTAERLEKIERLARDIDEFRRSKLGNCINQEHLNFGQEADEQPEVGHEKDDVAQVVSGSIRSFYCHAEIPDVELRNLHRELDAEVDLAYGVQCFANDTLRFAFLSVTHAQARAIETNGTSKKRQQTLDTAFKSTKLKIK